MLTTDDGVAGDEPQLINSTFDQGPMKVDAAFRIEELDSVFLFSVSSRFDAIADSWSKKQFSLSRRASTTGTTSKASCSRASQNLSQKAFLECRTTSTRPLSGRKQERSTFSKVPLVVPS